MRPLSCHAIPAAPLRKRILTAAGVILAACVGIFTTPVFALLFVHVHH